MSYREYNEEGQNCMPSDLSLSLLFTTSQLWENLLAFLSFSFFLYRMRIIVTVGKFMRRIKVKYKALCSMLGT